MTDSVSRMRWATIRPVSRPATYPLVRLAALRAQRAAGAAIDLAAALRGHDEAEAALARAVARHTGAVAAARGVVLCEAGPTPVWAIARREAYGIRLRRDVERARVGVTAREGELAGWREMVSAARGQVVTTRAEREVVDRHRSRWQEDQRRARERRES